MVYSYNLWWEKFNLDGPDGVKYYWHYLCLQLKQFCSRHSGGRSAIVWAGISLLGKPELYFNQSAMNIDIYTDALQNSLILLAYYNFGTAREAFLFMQNSAPVYTFAHSKNSFKESYMNIMNWRALSPHCTLNENIRGALKWAVYCAGKQYNSVRELKCENDRQWWLLAPTMIYNCTSLMRQRYRALMQCNGSDISY